MLNAVLSQRLRVRLADLGIELLEARAVPPNDAGVSLGQAWVAQRSELHGDQPCAWRFPSASSS
jgi:hydrogenase maturation protein HypF